MDHGLRASRLKPVLQQQEQHQQQRKRQRQLPAFVGAASAAKPATLQRMYRSPSRGAAGLAFVLIAGGVVDLAVPASRLKPLLQQQRQRQLPACVGAASAAKPATLQRPYRSPSRGAAGLGFVLMAGGAVDHALRASRLKPLLQQQRQRQLPAFVGAASAAKLATLQRPYWSPSWGAAGLGFVLMAGGAVGHAVRASRLKPLLQQQHQHQEQLPAFAGATGSRCWWPRSERIDRHRSALHFKWGCNKSVSRTW